jgi:hypothetical protein
MSEYAPGYAPDEPQTPSGPTDAAGGVPPLSEAEIAEIRAHAEAAQREEDGHICLTPRLCLALLDRLEAAEHARQQALSLAEQRAETITAYARRLVELRAALAEERQARETALTEAVRVLHRADSRLGLLLSRGGIQWGYGVGEQQDTSQVIGEIRRTIALLEEATHG